MARDRSYSRLSELFYKVWARSVLQLESTPGSKAVALRAHSFLIASETLLSPEALEPVYELWQLQSRIGTAKSKGKVRTTSHISYLPQT